MVLNNTPIKKKILMSNTDSLDKYEEEERFYTNMNDLINLIQDLVLSYNSGDNNNDNNKKKIDIDPLVIQLIKKFLESYNKKELIKSFIDNSYQYWDQILNHEEKFFTENFNNIFDFSSYIKEVDAFKILFESEITVDDKNIIWDYFKSFIKISIKYIHNKRSPKIKIINAEKFPIYTKNEFPKVKLQFYARKENIVLEWIQ